MSIRVVARIRPQHKSERDHDVILSTHQKASAQKIKIPNPKNEKELFAFDFSGVYDQDTSQESLFATEIFPTIKHLFSGFDVTIFAYGSTGTGKTHTMRGGKSLSERGVIPRFLSGVYRRARKTTRDSENSTKIQIMLSYYEIYNDKVFDLFEPPDRRSAAGLTLKDYHGKTVIVGLTERPCETLKDFERLYDEANVNRSTKATKLNASSSRSHAILRLNLIVTTENIVRVSTASCIDLAGSEDNRRTENGKDRMVESASINKSLFTLAKCAEAISNRDARIPYRESKMTRILSLGQNKGLTVMILNLAPIRSYHLDSLSSLNFANRTKKIEVREIENEPMVKGCPQKVPSISGVTLVRQPLRPLHATSLNPAAGQRPIEKQVKSFAVFSDRNTWQPGIAPARDSATSFPRRSSPSKRSADSTSGSISQPCKRRKQLISNGDAISKQAIEDMIERKVTDILTARAMDQPAVVPQKEISEEVQRRLELLEKKIERKDDGREQGLNFLFMAKQHAVRGEVSSALAMYTLARDFFPNNEKLEVKIARLKALVSEGKKEKPPQGDIVANTDNETGDSLKAQQLLEIVNSGEIERIRQLKGVGNKKAETMQQALQAADSGEPVVLTCLSELMSLRGVGIKAVEKMLAGI